MHRRQKSEQVIKTEIKTEVNADIKTELKTEVGDFSKKSAGFLCPSCQAHFLFSDKFVKHVRGHHLINSDGLDTGNYLSSSGQVSSQNVFIVDDLEKRSLSKSSEAVFIEPNMVEKQYRVSQKSLCKGSGLLLGL